MSSRARSLLLCAAASLCSLALAAPASASPSSQITTPAGTAFPLVEGIGTLTVAGSSDLPEVELRCYFGTAANSYLTLERNLAVTNGSFSVAASLAGVLLAAPCQLRAVPVGESVPLPPGETEPYEGPLLVASSFSEESDADYFAGSASLPADFLFEDAGGLGLESRVYSAPLHASLPVFFGDAALPAVAASGGARAALQVDGADAYAPAAAREVEEEDVKAPVPGRPAVAVSHTFDPATHQLQIREQDPIVRCSPGGVFPPTKASCAIFVPTGVTLVREWRTSEEDRVAALTDRWRSGDGLAHSLDARYYDELFSAGEAFEFSGESSFAPTKSGEAKPLRAGAGAILFKENPLSPEAGDGVYPQGAIAFDGAPSAPVNVGEGSDGSATNAIEMRYERQIAAGGEAPVRMAFVQAFSLAKVRSLVQSALAAFKPSLAIAYPASGATVTSPVLTVTGTAADSGALASIGVGGRNASLSDNGSWSVSVTLTPGQNTIDVTALDAAGLSTTGSVTVTYAPASAVPAKLVLARRSLHTLRHALGVTLSCTGTSGSCLAKLTLTAVVRIRRGRVASVAARAKTRTVTLGRLRTRIAAGHTRTLTITLNRLGRRLQARFPRLPLKLTVLAEGRRLLARRVVLSARASASAR
jgi:hypothetical protein